MTILYIHDIPELSLKCLTGLDDLSARFFRDHAENISYPTSCIIQLYLKIGVVPDGICTQIFLS